MDKITKRLQKLKTKSERVWKAAWGKTQSQLDVNVVRIARDTVSQMYNGITTSELDTFAAEVSAYITDDPDYGLFAGNILASNLESNNKAYLKFSDYAIKAFSYVNEATGKLHPLISDELFRLAMAHGPRIDAKLKMERNMLFDYFAMKTLMDGYLLSTFESVQINGVVQKTMVPFETPQHMWMRVALGINGSDLDAAFELYDVMSMKKATHATPTLFNSGTRLPQLSSCFLLDMKEDSISGIYDTVKNCALISKFAGGIGLSVNKIRASGSYIASTNGSSNGLVPMLKVFNATARYCDQGGGKRKGSFAIYISPYHADIVDWLHLKKNTGADEVRARDLFYALWISDLFMKRVIQEFARNANEDPDPVMWSLMDPNAVQGLDEVYGDEFEAMYVTAEREKKFVRQMPIRDLWVMIMETQIETGTPYMLFKDHCNRKSNQKNIGVIHSSNLCCEIMEHTDAKETAVCNLASLSLPAFVHDGTFDFEELSAVTRVMVRNLDRVIDRNFYPVEEAKTSNSRHRPIGLGIQGLADVFCKLRMPFDSEEARRLNIQIAEVMYFAALTESNALAVVYGPYSTIDMNGGAPVRNGIFQQDMWTVHPPQPDAKLDLDWDGLREKVKKSGVRNSLLIAHMPTASTSQILGNTESFEPYYSNIYARKTKMGEFFCYNRLLVKELRQLGLWKTELDPMTKKKFIPIKEKIIAHSGSIQHLLEIPEDVRRVYKTLMDIPLKTLTLMSRDRSYYIDQGSSLNVYHKNRDNMMVPMTQYLCYAWSLGLKTGSYYTRTIQDLNTLNFAGSSKKTLTDQKEEPAKVDKSKTPSEEANESLKMAESGQATIYVCKEDVCTSCSG